jgi:hypothetical protein
MKNLLFLFVLLFVVTGCELFDGDGKTDNVIELHCYPNPQQNLPGFFVEISDADWKVISAAKDEYKALAYRPTTTQYVAFFDVMSCSLWCGKKTTRNGKTVWRSQILHSPSYIGPVPYTKNFYLEPHYKSSPVPVENGWLDFKWKTIRH